MPATRPSRNRLGLSAAARLSPGIGRAFVAGLVRWRYRAGLADRGEAGPGVTRRSFRVTTVGGSPGAVPLAVVIAPGRSGDPWPGVGGVPIHPGYPSGL